MNRPASLHELQLSRYAAILLEKFANVKGLEHID